MEKKTQNISILRDFHKITGARISLHDTFFNEIAAYPENLNPFCEKVQQNKNARSLCITADRKAFEKVKATGEPFTYKCHCGLIETVAPIYHYGVLSGYFMMGQIIGTEQHSLETVMRLSERFFENNQELENASVSIPTLSSSLTASCINIMSIIAEYMTRTNRVAPKLDNLADSVRHYINSNYSGDLSVNTLCSVFECSRTTLMNTFKSKHNMTVGEYITAARLQKSVELLKGGAMSIKSIALQCGFSDQNYYSKVFFKHHKTTPSEFRKKHRRKTAK